MKKILTFLAVLLFSALALLVTTNSATAQPSQQTIREISGLQTRPNLPVRSIILRHDFPDHPLGGPPGKERLPKPGKGCDKDVDLTGTIAGVVNIAAQDNTICTNADLDTYIRGSDTFVVQAGGDDAAWTHTDVTDPANPTIVGQFVWSGGAGKNTYTPDVKTFSQGDNDYIVMGLERRTLNAFCGVIIVNVNDPGNPVIESQFIGSGWCDTHNVFVEDDASGDGQYIYATADAPNDMRVLDISGIQGGSVGAPVEIGRYTSPTASNANYVHDVTVIDHGGATGRRAYLSYWDNGLVILEAADVTPGTSPTPVVAPNQLDPAGFLTHHAWANQTGDRVFIQDEFLNSFGDEPVQMWDVSNPASPTYVDGLALGTDVPVNPAHNLEIRFDIDPNRLYVGWYKLGLQAWDFTISGFDHSANPAPRTAVQYHQVQTETNDGDYSGAWGVRLENIGTNLYIFQSDRNFGLIIDCVGCAPPPPSPTPTPTPEPEGTGGVKGKVTNASTGKNLNDVSVKIVETGQSDSTNKGGRYSIGDVPEGDVTVEASMEGFVTQSQEATVTAGQTTTLNFSLVPVE
ncbi:carboxypeptidase regulatory-like domain-containing protein [Patescibacteria group bacterium]|nr:carboxypeptidase regulatory-like domain-containing protein [Patescibacteria group bacterium]